MADYSSCHCFYCLSCLYRFFWNDFLLAGREELIGKTAEATTEMEPKGIVFIQGERWAAILDKGRVEPGEEVIITKVEGLKLRVTKKE